ncbi:E3 ubiquitin-protein ligase EL5 [Brachypodium distachyon]|uniref:RING-type E3 ubiquitin transferase n=1 Tax=Brachypodium distachyon TaxID=15368 RepID=I1I2C9_BRADI|nr:E3 ubiquitin-protein ligase EL5 [Brachypodium distachyon]KQJ95808.1 hypothetical protein BRADI_3g19160v3 [Brachypodium distachyon]|eukprot:XP_003571584.1 E3 ubiquitin-protein ligase EL5 [Brachypodium distachyon]
MLNLYPRLSVAAAANEDHYAAEDYDDDDDVGRSHRNRALYGIGVVCVSIFLFCVLAAAVSVLKALAFAGTVALLLLVLGCLAPRTTWVLRPPPRRRPANAVLALTARGGCACAPANVPPAFAYACPAGEGEVEGMRCGVMCPVCLEEVRGGEMVRQLPACGHVFHVECIDMWLHSHRTCPMCRCVVSPPPTTVADKASEETAEAPVSASQDEALPPV